MKSTNDHPSYKTTIELYLLFCLSSGMLSFGFTESFLASHGCAMGHREKTFGLAESTYKKIAAVAHSIPICALSTDDGVLGENSVGRNGLTVEAAAFGFRFDPPRDNFRIVAHSERIPMARQQNNLILEADWNH